MLGARFTPSPAPSAKVIAGRRHDWRKLLAAALKVASRAIETDGREVVEPDDFRHALATIGRGSFPSDGNFGSASLADAFRLTAQAFTKAGTDRRRAIIAGPLASLAQALDDLITDQATVEAAEWKRRSGERGD